MTAKGTLVGVAFGLMALCASGAAAENPPLQGYDENVYTTFRQLIAQGKVDEAVRECNRIAEQYQGDDPLSAFYRAEARLTAACLTFGKSGVADYSAMQADLQSAIPVFKAHMEPVVNGCPVGFEHYVESLVLLGRTYGEEGDLRQADKYYEQAEKAVRDQRRRMKEEGAEYPYPTFDGWLASRYEWLASLRARTASELRFVLDERYKSPEFQAVLSPVEEHAHSGEYETAVTECDEIIRRNPENAEMLLAARWMRAEALAQGGKPDAAVEAYRDLLAHIRPQDTPEYRLLVEKLQMRVGSICLDQGHPAEAAMTFLRLIDQHEDSTASIYWAAQAVQMLKRCFDDNTEYAKRLAQLWGKHQDDTLAPFILFEIGLYHEVQGHLEQALESYKELGKRFPESGCARTARERMEALEAVGDGPQTH